MNKLYLRKVLGNDRTIDLNYEFENNSNGQELSEMNEVIKKFNKAIETFEKDEKPGPKKPKYAARKQDEKPA